MVTANANNERRPSSAVDSQDDETNIRIIRNHLDRLYLNNFHYNHPHHSYHQYTSHTITPTNSRDTHMTSNTVPIYRHGRKFYVSIDEYERLRAEERRNRRALIQKSQNLPVTKFPNQTNVRIPSTLFYNPIHRSSSHSNEYRYGVSQVLYSPQNIILNNDNNNIDIDNRNEVKRQSRSTLRRYEANDADRNDLKPLDSLVTVKLLPTTRRSNSSDKVLDLRRTPQPTASPYTNYDTDEYDLKRSYSAEDIQPTRIELQQSQIPFHRTSSRVTTDYGMSTESSFPITAADQTYNQSNNSKLPSYVNRTTLTNPNATIKQSSASTNVKESIHRDDIRDSYPTYSSYDPSSLRTIRTDLTPTLIRSASSNNNNNEYYYPEATSASYSDDNSSSPSILTQRRRINRDQYYRSEYPIERDDRYGENFEAWPRTTARSQSSDRLTEKKRVRFADTEGFTLEIVPDFERQRSPMINRPTTRSVYSQPANSFQRQIQTFHKPFYQTNTRIDASKSKLATDV